MRPGKNLLMQKQLHVTQKEKSGLSGTLYVVDVFFSFCTTLSNHTLSIVYLLIIADITYYNYLIFLIFCFYFPVFSDLERVLNLNLGQEEEFSPLQGKCFEYTDRE